jgi:hypothetical protein
LASASSLRNFIRFTLCGSSLTGEIRDALRRADAVGAVTVRAGDVGELLALCDVAARRV